MRRSVVIYPLAVWFAVLPLSVRAQEGDIRGPKPLVEVPQPVPPTPWGMVVLSLVVAAALIGVLVWWLLRKRVVAVSPEEAARRELSRLRSDGESMDAGEFAEAASGVLRRFIEQRFGVAAPKRTTEEFLQEVLDGAHGLEERVEALRGFLRACDLAKFAGEDLDKLQREDLLLKARGFVNEPVRTNQEAAA